MKTYLQHNNLLHQRQFPIGFHFLTQRHFRYLVHQVGYHLHKHYKIIKEMSENDTGLVTSVRIFFAVTNWSGFPEKYRMANRL